MSYLIFGEFGIAIVLARLVKHVAHGNWTTVMQAGIGAGIGIFLCYALAHSITDGLSTK